MDKKILKAGYNGNLTIGNLEIDASVLEDGTRVLSYRSVNRVLGQSEKWSKGASELPPFLAKKELSPFISEDLTVPLSNPIEYKPLHGGRTAFGVPATLLPEICDIWLKAREAGGLKSKRDLLIAMQAETVVRALAHIGIIALVDEATGYQEVREKQELQKILAKYISPELLPWTMKFPEEFYKEMFRLKGWTYMATSKKQKPMMAGKITREIVYDKLPKGVIEEISKRNPRKEETGLRQYHQHRFLTNDIGNPHLSKQIAVVIALMRISANWRIFDRNFKRAFGGQQDLGLDKDDE